MRICLISREYPTDDHGGGIGTYTEKSARALAALGHAVDVFTEASGQPSTSLEQGVTVRRLAPPRARHLRTLARARVVAQALGELDRAPDIVQACEFGAEAALYSFRKRPATRLVTRLATPSFVVRELNEHGQRGGAIARAQLDGLERLQTRRSDAVFSISRALADVVCPRWHLPREKVAVLKTGVDFSSSVGPAAGELPPFLAGRDYILFFGRLEERKGVHVLAESLTEVLADHPALEAVFAGASLPYRGRPMDDFVRECNHQYLDRLHFLPRQSQRELYPLLANALVIVLPSLWEGLGNVALEAIDMGRPVVTTSGSGLAEVVEDGDSGLLVPPGDVAALRAAIRRLVDDPALRTRLAAGAKKRAESFELVRVTRDLVAFYEAVCSSAGGFRAPPGGH